MLNIIYFHVKNYYFVIKFAIKTKKILHNHPFLHFFLFQSMKTVHEIYVHPIAPVYQHKLGNTAVLEDMKLMGGDGRSLKSDKCGF